MLTGSRVLVTGGKGLVGTALARQLRESAACEVFDPSSAELDLCDRGATERYFQATRPDFVFHLAGYVHGIMGNMLNQAEAYLRNTLINTNVVEQCVNHGVSKVVAMGTIAMYPEPSPRLPLREEDLWQGPPYFAEYGYANAKRGMVAHLEACRQSYDTRYAVAISTNLFGPNDQFNTATGHVVPSLVRKFFEAKARDESVYVWGDGTQERDFLYVEDAARGLRVIMEQVTGLVNLASGVNRTIRDVVSVLEKHVGMQDRVQWDTSKPRGQERRTFDVSVLTSAGFSAQHDFDAALRTTYDWYAANAADARD